MRTAKEIRRYFVDVLNSALVRLGMYGGEIAARSILDDLAYVDEREDELKSLLDELSARGGFSPIGVAGAFKNYTKMPASDNEIGSVYAEIAFQMQYLATDRVLKAKEFESLKRAVVEACSARDFTTVQVRDQFGTPSWSSGTNPYCPCVYLYVTRQPTYSSIAFDFWNEVDYDRKAEKTLGRFGDLPVLRDVRIRGAHFSSDFIFTPKGRAMIKSAHRKLNRRTAR